MKLVKMSKNMLSIRFRSGQLLTSYYFPGLWLPDDKLETVRQDLSTITNDRLEMVPEYGIYLEGREPFTNRIITICYEDENRPIGFSAMVLCNLNSESRLLKILHLGLVIITRHRPFPNLMFCLYFLPVSYYWMTHWFRSFWISSVSMEPAIIGSVCDHFVNVYPHYEKKLPPSGEYQQLAVDFISQFSHEFGMGPGAWFDSDTFVIHNSCCGPSESLRSDYKHAAKYLNRKCNHFCRNTLNYEAGDELLQIGYVSFAGVVRAGLHAFRKGVN